MPRATKTVMHEGKVLEYIEATIDDVATANKLAHEVLGRSLDELLPRTRALLLLLDELVSEIERDKAVARRDVRFTRREVRERSGWGDTHLKVPCSGVEQDALDDARLAPAGSVVELDITLALCRLRVEAGCPHRNPPRTPAARLEEAHRARLRVTRVQRDSAELDESARRAPRPAVDEMEREQHRAGVEYADIEARAARAGFRGLHGLVARRPIRPARAPRQHRHSR